MVYDQRGEGPLSGGAFCVGRILSSSDYVGNSFSITPVGNVLFIGLAVLAIVVLAENSIRRAGQL